MSAFKALLLDLDGTLVDSRMDLVDAVNYTLRHLGHPPQTVAEIVPRIGNGLRRLLTDTIGMTDKVELKKAKDVFEAFYGDHCLDKTVPYKGVFDSVQTLSNRLKLAVVTNKPQAFAEKILNHLGFTPFLGVVIGGDVLAAGKPDPAPLNEAMRILDVEPSATMIVGDGHQDLNGGMAAGVQRCLVRYGFGFQADLLALKPDYVIDRFADLKEIVK